MLTRFWFLLAVLPTAVIFLACERIQAEEPWTVVLRSGRTFTAAVDPRTDGRRLWLRFGDEHTWILRPVAWNAIVAARRGDHDVPLELLRAAAAESASPLADRREADDSSNLLPSREDSRLEEPLREEVATPLGAPTFLEPKHPPHHPMLPARVATVSFDAHLANWDADAQPDGLVVVVRPLDAWGALAHVEGVMDVELLGVVRRDFDAAPRSRGLGAQTLGRWTKSLGQALPTPHGWLVKLPFSTNLPWDEVAASRGRIRVRLTVPGHGVFEDLRDGIAIQPFTPTAWRLHQAP